MSQSLSARGLESLLDELLQLGAEEHDELEDVRVSTFEDAGVMTRNRGLVVRLSDGSEFQVSIVQSAYGEGADDEDDDEEGES